MLFISMAYSIVHLARTSVPMWLDRSHNVSHKYIFVHRRIEQEIGVIGRTTCQNFKGEPPVAWCWRTRERDHGEHVYMFTIITHSERCSNMPVKILCHCQSHRSSNKSFSALKSLQWNGKEYYLLIFNNFLLWMLNLITLIQNLSFKTLTIILILVLNIRIKLLIISTYSIWTLA